MDRYWLTHCNKCPYFYKMCFPGALDGKASARVQSLGWEDLLEKEMAIHSSILAWKIPWMEEPATVHGVAKSQTRLSDFTLTFHFHALEKETATHSSVLAWRIPGTEEPVGLPSMGSQRVGHDCRDLAAEEY